MLIGIARSAAASDARTLAYGPERGTEVEKALAVLVCTPETRKWLAENDPQALRQARQALGLTR